MPLPYPDPPLADERVVLRPWAERDVACAEEGKGFGRQDALAWIARQDRRQAEGAGLSLAIAEPATGEAVGVVGLLFRPEAGLAPEGADGDGLVFQPDRRMAGVGYWVLEGARRRGLASHAVGLLADWALGSAGLLRVEALVEPANVASRRVLERAGFEREGLLHGYLAVPRGRADAFIYARLAAPPGSRPERVVRH